MRILHSALTLLVIAIVASIFSSSCTKPKPDVPIDPVDSTTLPKYIQSATFIKYDNLIIDSSKALVSFNGDTVNILVPPGTCLSNLTPHFLFKGASIEPANDEPQNFLSPVNYTITDGDGNTKTYVVHVTWYNTNGIVYMGTNSNTLFAIDAVLGGFYWKFTPADKGSFSYSGPAVQNGIVYAGSTNGNMYALDAAGGNVIWTFAASESIESGPAVKDGVVYFGSDDDYFYAVDALSGKLKWKYKTGHNVSTVPVVVDNIVYTGSDDANLYAFDTSGNVKWTYTAGSIFNASSPVYDNGTIFIGCRDGNLYAIDAITGNEKWKYFNGGISLEQSRPSVSNGVVYIGGWYNLSNNDKGSVYAVNEETGALITTYLNNLAFSSSPYVQDSSLYISADDLNFYCINTNTGAVNWLANILPNGASAIAVNNVVYTGGGGTGFIYAFDTQTGNIKWQLQSDGGSSTSTPCFFAADGNVYHTNIKAEH